MNIVFVGGNRLGRKFLLQITVALASECDVQNAPKLTCMLYLCNVFVSNICTHLLKHGIDCV